MTSFIGRRRTGSAVPAAWLAVLLFGLCACQHAPHARHEGGDPNMRLAQALERYDMAKAYGPDNGTLMSDQSVISDSGGGRLAVEQLALEYPVHVPTLLMCADLAYQEGEREKASAYADRVLAIQPTNVFASIIRARTAIQDGSLTRARSVLESQIRLTPESPHTHEVLAGVHFLGGDLAACERELSECERLRGDMWRVAYNRGLVAERRGDFARARDQYRQAIKLQPSYPEAESRLAGLSSSPDAK